LTCIYRYCHGLSLHAPLLLKSWSVDNYDFGLLHRITSPFFATLFVMSLCQARLTEERKQWRKDHPFGFFAKPVRGSNGVVDLKTWDVGIPGRDKTIWEGGLFKLTLIFPDEYPTKPPKCKAVSQLG
jgi:hypothetical protein